MILTVLGARPQFVKAAALSNSFQRFNIPERVIHTGQHYDYDMSDVFFAELGIPGVYNNLSIGSGSHGKQTGEMLPLIESEILNLGSEIKALLVYGDTNSTLAGALAASKLHTPVIHVEAGLRSFNRTMPEEVNRVLTDHISNLLFCSSNEAKMHLKNEGIIDNVHVVGDIMYDSMLTFKPFSKSPELGDLNRILDAPFNLLTIHRPANTNQLHILQSILHGVAQCEKPCLWPVHPRVKPHLKSLEIGKNIHLVSPLSYFEMLFCLEKASTVFTDSGGLQKEAYWMKKQCITIRPQTEWVETLHDQWNTLVSPNVQDLTAAYYNKPSEIDWYPLYGDGKSGDLIAEIIKNAYYA